MPHAEKNYAEESNSLVIASTRRPWFVAGAMLLSTFILLTLAVVPSLWPQTFTMLAPLKVDTDPENMLSKTEPVRIFHGDMKKEMSLHDMVVVGVINEKNPQGVLNPDSLRNIYELTQFAKNLRGAELGVENDDAGVIGVDVIAPSTVDNLEQGGPGVVKFERLMARPPATHEEALAIRKKAERIPFLRGTLLSEDGKSICIYLPISSKDLSYKVSAKLKEKIATFKGDDEYHITGLPVAEDTFGVEMFRQMAISAPLAMLIVFLLMLFFFRKLVLIISPMIVAMVSVICTMSLLVITDNTVHIMSSMIPIFIMPIAVLDAIHILSDFFDRYPRTRDRRATILNVMKDLFTPMLYTSLTTAVGFASLALTPIPPVQVFGLFVAFGVMVAWILTITFIPAYVMFIPERWLGGFGGSHAEHHENPRSPLARFLQATGRMTFNHAKGIMLIVAALIVVAVWGITRIRINDNPIKWFTPSHPIRVADRKLNEHFGGTYMAYLALEAEGEEETVADFAASLQRALEAEGKRLKDELPAAPKVFVALGEKLDGLKSAAKSKEKLLSDLNEYADEQSWDAPDAEAPAWDRAIKFLGTQTPSGNVFRQPDVLNYVAELQKYLLTTGVVGKSNSLADIVKTVRRELFSGEESDFRIPDTPKGVAECITQFESSHRPQDVWHFVTSDFSKTVIWVQLKSGDNRDMQKVIDAVDAFFSDPATRPPVALTHRWFGLTYINVVWQRKMVLGMVRSFLGSFLCVFLMMTLLYRSTLWGILSMIPLTVTVGFIYGVIGIIGKEYDMPVAILSALSLGLAVDYAIHFLSRSRQLYTRYGSWEAASGPVFGEPARAISRNVIVVGVGFLPLLAAPLVPYQTVGIFIAAILISAGVASLFILPSLFTLLERWLFPKTKLCCLACNCTTCIVSAAALTALVAVNVRQFINLGWTTLTWLGIVAIVILAAICAAFSIREKCRGALAAPWLEKDKGEEK